MPHMGQETVDVMYMQTTSFLLFGSIDEGRIYASPHYYMSMYLY